jgi:hypothetical protein
MATWQGRWRAEYLISIVEPLQRHAGPPDCLPGEASLSTRRVFRPSPMAAEPQDWAGSKASFQAGKGGALRGW